MKSKPSKVSQATKQKLENYPTKTRKNENSNKFKEGFFTH